MTNVFTSGGAEIGWSVRSLLFEFVGVPGFQRKVAEAQNHLQVAINL